MRGGGGSCGESRDGERAGVAVAHWALPSLKSLPNEPEPTRTRRVRIRRTNKFYFLSFLLDWRWPEAWPYTTTSLVLYCSFKWDSSLFFVLGSREAEAEVAGHCH